MTLTIGERIALARKRCGITQAELQDVVGVGKNLLSMTESGTRDPRYSEVVKIAQALGYDDIVQFLSGEDPTVDQTAEATDTGRK